jgi:hypothetical protein
MKKSSGKMKPRTKENTIINNIYRTYEDEWCIVDITCSSPIALSLSYESVASRTMGEPSQTNRALTKIYNEGLSKKVHCF